MENQNVPQKQEEQLPWYKRAQNYFEDLRMEMRRVTWPTWEQVRATTTIVVVAVFAFAAYFTVVDFFVERGISKVFQTFTR